MSSLRRLIWTIPISLAVTASVASAIVQPKTESSGSIDLLPASATRAPRAEVQQALSRGPAWREFQSRYGTWGAQWNEATATPHRAIGKAIPLSGFANDAVSADRSVRAFIARNQKVFGADRSLELAGAHLAGEVWYVRYRQTVAGIPLLDSDWEFRVGTNGNLMAFGADAHQPPARLAAAPRIGIGVAREAARQGLAFNPARDRVVGDQLWVLPYENRGTLEYRLVYMLDVWTAKPRGHWTALVDATSGEVLSRRDRHLYAITGNVSAQVHPERLSDPLASRPLPNAYVNAGATQTFTDPAGNYSLNVTGTVTITSRLRGRFVDVDKCVDDLDPCTSSDATYSSTASNPTSGKNIVWQAPSHVSERDAYYHVNRAHDWIKTIDPAFTACDYEVKTYVELVDNCNAYWDGASLNFLTAGTGCPATAQLPDIVYHEYSHAVTENLYIAHGRPMGMENSVLQEGIADAMSAFLPDDPVIGDGFFGAGTFLRNIATANKKWPADNNPVDKQTSGLIFAGAMWDLRVSAGLTTAQRLLHFAKYGLPDDANNGAAFNEFFVEALVADDTDANLSNGTPHYTQIVNAFNAHGIGTNYFINIAAPLEDQPNTGPFPVNAVITYGGLFGGLDVTSPRLYYSVNGQPFTFTPMFPTGNPDEYGAQIPSQAFAVIKYYIQAGTVDGGTKTEPHSAPVRYNSFIAGPYSVLTENDFDNDLGWTIGASGDGATSGLWLRADPVGTPIQPENDHSPTGTICYVTGNGAPFDGIGIADVDGGKTSLVSPTFNATAGGMIRPVISYWRWFSNNSGDNPAQDPWKVEISNNGGSNWVTVENTLVTDESWTRKLFFIGDYVTPTSTMKLRFVATDDATFPSLVEAAVDDFALYAFPPSVGIEDGIAGTAFALSAARPNPFRVSTVLSYTLAERGRVDLEIYDLQGRSVRELVAEEQSPGPHRAEWDGKDRAGRIVAAGPYFVRLSQNGRKTSGAVVVVR